MAKVLSTEYKKTHNSYATLTAAIGVRLRNKATWLARNTDGATAVEYGLLAGLVAIGLAGGLGSLSDLVNLLFETVGAETAQVTSNLADS